MRVLFLSDTHLGFDLPARPRSARPRRGPDFFESYQLALGPARSGEVDAVVHGGDLLYRSRVPAWLTEAALAPLRCLAAGGLPVLLLPGNHERSRVPHPLLAVQRNLFVFDRPRTVVVEARGLRAAFAGFAHERDARARFPALLAAARAGEPAADVRLLCLHQCVEGATCGPGDFTFRWGDDVVRSADLPRDVAAVLCGHVHRHQVLRAPGAPPVVYAGSTERTSWAEAGEAKGYVLLDLSRAGLERLEFRPLPDRPPPTARRSRGADGVRVPSAHGPREGGRAPARTGPSQRLPAADPRAPEGNRLTVEAGIGARSSGWAAAGKRRSST